MPPESFRCVVLSYHSWETNPDMLLDDVASARSRGWSTIGIDELHDAVARRTTMRGRCVLVTTDDGHPEDEDWVPALRSAGCPAVTFVNVGRLDDRRAASCRALGRDPLVAVEDHGRWHRRCFVGSRVLGVVAAGAHVGGLEHLGLPVGFPICASSGELSAPAFLPDPRVAAVAEEAAGEWLASREGAEEGLRGAVTAALLRAGLARLRLGHAHLAGRFEDRGEYVARVRRTIADNRESFTRVIGRPPRFHAFTWWQGSREADAALAEHGYLGSFWGRDRAQRADGRCFAVPRLAVVPDTPRPLALDLVRPRAHVAPGATGPVKRLLKTALGLR